jgi:beta-N-acetylhexosaminidase
MHPFIGSVILFTRNFANIEQLTQLVQEIHALRTPSLLVAVDHEGGRVQRFRQDFTVLPAMRLIGRQYDIDTAAGRRLAHQCGWLMASEVRAAGIDFSFAPVVDLDYGVSSVIGDRAFHRDPRAVAELAIAFAGGMRQAGTAAIAKHFPGHGAVVADSHLALPVDRRPYADLSDDLYPYERLIDNDIPAIMAAHVVFTEVDDRPATFSKRWLQTELRGRLRFSGAIFSDDLTMQGAGVMGGVVERIRAAWEAGCDVLPICNNRPGVVEVLATLGNVTDPTSQIRLARLRGRAAPGRAELMASEQWQQAHQAVSQLTDRPDFSLNA